MRCKDFFSSLLGASAFAKLSLSFHPLNRKYLYISLYMLKNSLKDYPISFRFIDQSIMSLDALKVFMPNNRGLEKPLYELALALTRLPELEHIPQQLNSFLNNPAIRWTKI